MILSPLVVHDLLHAASEHHRREVKSVARRVRDQLVAPVCQKHNLFFRGTSLPLDYYFYKNDDTWWNSIMRTLRAAERHLGEEPARDLAHVFAVLALEVDTFTVLGHHVEDVLP
jgi:hypothetical protein